MAVTKDGLLLLTGGTGFIGILSLYHALLQGYKVRAVIRSEAKKDTILGAPKIQSLDLADGQLEFAIVPDITAKGCYEYAIENVRYVLHIASPIPTQNMHGHIEAKAIFIDPAVNGVTNMLNAAQSAGSVVQVVITSSAVALMAPKFWTGVELTDRVHDGKTRTENVEGPYENPAQAYLASKIAALNATDKWVEENKPQFGVINIHPSWVLGPSEFVQSREDFMKGTSKYLVAVALHKESEFIGKRRLAGVSVHVDDVAQVQVAALEKDVKDKGGYTGYVTSLPMTWDEIGPLTGQLFPKEIEKGTVSLKGSTPTAPIQLDSRSTETDFNIKFRGLREQVKDGVGQYLRLPETA